MFFFCNLGQTAVEDKNHLITIQNNDDRILNCCLQLREQSKKVILVTNDIHLLNKGRINEVESITIKKCLEKFE